MSRSAFGSRVEQAEAVAAEMRRSLQSAICLAKLAEHTPELDPIATLRKIRDSAQSALDLDREIRGFKSRHRPK